MTGSYRPQSQRMRWHTRRPPLIVQGARTKRQTRQL